MWKQVTSSNIKAVKYDKTSMSLCVQFKNGSVYCYNNVPLSVANGLETAPSVGTFFAEKVKNSYDYEKLD